MQTTAQPTELDQKLAAPMFWLTLLWLLIAGIGMHLLQDADGRYFDGAIYCGAILVVLWTAYFFEAYFHWSRGERLKRRDLLACFFPPTRLGGRDHATGESVWIPGMGWRTANDQLAAELELKLSYTMIAIALLILPLLVIENVYDTQIQNNRSLGLTVQFAQAFIWFAFTAEFMLSISLVSKKLKFVKKHWMDVAIICLPMIWFMRIFRITGATRLARLSRTAKVFRLRGTAMRAWRAVLILEIIDRLMHRDHTQRLAKLEAMIAEKKREIADLESQVASIKQQLSLTALENEESDVVDAEDSLEPSSTGRFV